MSAPKPLTAKAVMKRRASVSKGCIECGGPRAKARGACPICRARKSGRWPSWAAPTPLPIIEVPASELPQ